MSRGWAVQQVQPAVDGQTAAMVSACRGGHGSQVCWGRCAEPGWPGRALASGIQVTNPGREREWDIPSQCCTKDLGFGTWEQAKRSGLDSSHGRWRKRRVGLTQCVGGKEKREGAIRSEQRARAAAPPQVSAYTLPTGPLGFSLSCLLRCFPCQFHCRQWL